MSSATRNAEKRREREEQAIRDEEARAWTANRSMFEKINDATDIHDVKEILFEIAEHVGL